MAGKGLSPARVVADLRKAQERRKLVPTVALVGDGSRARVQAVCPTGHAVLDHWVLGIGGLPFGRVVEMFGAEGSGKDTIMDTVFASAQRSGFQPALVNTEEKWDPDWAHLHGVDVPNLIMDQPGCLEDGLATVEDLVKKSSPERRYVIAFNSVAALGTRKEADEGITGDPAVAEQARVWSRFCRIVVPLVSKHQALLLCINQVRSVIGNMYGPQETTPGGRALKCYASLRLNIGHGKFEDGKRSRRVKVQAWKNQHCPPMRSAELMLDFAEGFDDKWAIMTHAKEVGCVGPKERNVNVALEALGWPALAAGNESEQRNEEGESDGQEGDGDAEGVE